eukprot:1391446-Amorphochlora_amoeboformis.AAC.1
MSGRCRVLREREKGIGEILERESEKHEICENCERRGEESARARGREERRDTRERDNEAKRRSGRVRVREAKRRYARVRERALKQEICNSERERGQEGIRERA